MVALCWNSGEFVGIVMFIKDQYLPGRFLTLISNCDYICTFINKASTLYTNRTSGSMATTEENNNENSQIC